MEHDQIAARLRLALERETARHELSPDGWSQIERRHRRRSRRRAGIAALSVAAAAAVALAVVAGPGRRHRASSTR
jgi:negative regulator of sigma E activity